MYDNHDDKKKETNISNFFSLSTPSLAITYLKTNQFSHYDNWITVIIRIIKLAALFITCNLREERKKKLDIITLFLGYCYKKAFFIASKKR